MQDSSTDTVGVNDVSSDAIIWLPVISSQVKVVEYPVFVTVGAGLVAAYNKFGVMNTAQTAANRAFLIGLFLSVMPKINGRLKTAKNKVD